MPDAGRLHGTLRRALVLLAAAGLLAGCASIPTSGPVLAGPAESGDVDAGLRFQPLSPADGASPSEIVRGFLLAASGVEEDHAHARAYLTDGSAREWRPGTGTVVYDSASAALSVAQDGVQLTEGEQPSPDAESVSVTLSAGVVATLDPGGRYEAAAPGTWHEATYDLARVDGQWRVSSLPEGLLVDEAGFGLAFSSYRLYFADPASSFLVPEVRWFPERRSVATTLASELLRGPSPWLRGAVVSGFPDGTRLSAPAAVPVVEGEAQVDLTGTALEATSDSRALMQAQMQATLLPVRTISTVRLTVENGQLVLPGTVPPLVRDPVVATDPVAVAEGALVQVEEEAVVPVAGLPPMAGLGVSDPAEGPASYAVLAAERTRLLHVVPGTEADPELLLTGADLTPPSYDPLLWIWSTPARSAGVVTAARAGADVAEVEADWLQGRVVSSLRISRDGTRALVVSSGPDGVAVQLAGVERDDDGRPRRLVPAGEGSLVPGLVAATTAVWTGESTVAVLGRTAADTAARVYLVEPPGPVVPAGAPLPAGTETVSLAGGNGERSLVAGTDDGRLWVRAGAQWVEVASDVAVTDPGFPG